MSKKSQPTRNQVIVATTYWLFGLLFSGGIATADYFFGLPLPLSAIWASTIVAVICFLAIAVLPPRIRCGLLKFMPWMKA